MNITNKLLRKQKISGAPLAIGYIGLITGLVGIIMLIPFIYILFNPSQYKYIPHFIIPSLSMILVGFVLFFLLLFKKEHGQLQNHQDAFIVLTSWIIAIFGTSIPFWASGLLNFHQAIFEITSGWTTTGLTVLDVEQGGINCFLLLRTLTMFFGGIGIILIMISIFSDRYGLRLYSAEGHSDRFLPNLLRSARMMFLIYVGLIVAGIIAFLCFGMNFFDAFTHSITAVSTGGFSNYNDSIGHFSSANGYNLIQTCGIQVTSLVLMFMGSISFISLSFLFRGQFKTFFKNFENHIEFVLLAIVIPLLVIATMVSNTVTSNDAAMFSIFYALSALTTCGFQITELSASTFPAILIILTFLMLIGAQSSSTSGAMKIGRLSLFFHSLYIKIRNSLNNLKTHHSDFVYVYDEELFLDESTLHDNNIFILAYLGIYFLGVIIFSFSGVNLSQALFETASLIGTVGLSTGMITSSSPTFFYYVGSAIMIFGRFEIFMIFYGIIYIFRKPYEFTRLLFARR